MFTPDALASCPAGRILVIDDDAFIRKLFAAVLERDGLIVESAVDGDAGIAAIERWMPDVVVLDANMPHRHGWDVCRWLKQNPSTRLTPVLLVTGAASVEERVSGIEAGADEFMSKPVHPVELVARVRSLLRMKRLTDELDSGESAFMVLARAIDARDPLTNGHCLRVASAAVRLGQRLGLDQSQIATLYRGAYLHDVGKIGVPDSVLMKPTALTADERSLMERHAEIGDHLCAPLRSLREARGIVRWHHERIDGSGYPDGLRGDAIPLLAQIVGIVDVFDAMTSARSYRPALTTSAGIAHVRREVEAGRFDPALVDLFLDQVGAGPTVAGAPSDVPAPSTSGLTGRPVLVGNDAGENLPVSAA
jgi:putative two-component system response regulator